MRNVLLTTLACIALPTGALAQNSDWANKLFKGDIAHDFGSVPRGAELYHRFPMTNIYAVPLTLSLRTSCGCVTATPSVEVLQPRQTGYIEITMDARRFTGAKTVSIYVTVGPQFVSTATLRVSAVSRADVVFNPGEVNFGTVAQGQTPSQTIDVEYAGPINWQIVDILKNNSPVDATFEPWYQRPGQVGYRVHLTLKPNAPPGPLKVELQVKTNDPASPLVPLLVEGSVQGALVIIPNVLSMGNLKVGDRVSRQVVVKGNKPFKILTVEGTGEGVDADVPQVSKPVQIITVKFQPEQVGELLKQLRIRTDLDQDSTATVTLEGSVNP